MNNEVKLFQEQVWQHYRSAGRHDLPWRQPEPDSHFEPYKIMVSELMLQQTQVQRVIPKYFEFLELFPTTQALAAASLGDVLRAWSGLGYNRRAKFLHQAAGKIVTEFDSHFPVIKDELVQLPGVGDNTAGAILAYAFNQPAVFIETNIRTIFIYHFFPDQTGVTDKRLLECINETLDYEHPREWYWALMDYGAELKKTTGNASQYAQNYTKQSTFHGSRRQVRGQIIRLLSQRPYSKSELASAISDERLKSVIGDLISEQLIRLENKKYTL